MEYVLSLLRLACNPDIADCIEELVVDAVASAARVDDMGVEIVFEEEALEVVEGTDEELRASSLTELVLASGNT